MEEAVQVNIEDFKQFNHKSVIDICNKSDSELFAYFQDIGILPKTRTCVCGSEMRHKVRPGRADAWRCKTKNCAKEIGYFKNTFFSNSNLDPREIFEFTYWWCRKFTKYDDLRWEMKRDAAKLSDHTINDWSQFCRDVCVEYFIRNPKVIGGEGKFVEIDETLIARRKYERGRIVNQVWVFGGVERGTSENCFMEIVEARNADTLLPIIQRRIAPGTTIVSDLWRAYFRIGELPEGYRHLTVNHSLNFVNPDDPAANTQTVESSWQKLKIPLKAKYGTCRDHYADYITEHCWRKEFGRNNEAFYHFWVHLLQHYSPQWV